jgi:hypothetical protein
LSSVAAEAGEVKGGSMKRIETGNFNQLTYKGGGGCVSLFGLPFFGFGVMFMIAGIMGTVKNKTGAPVGPMFPVLFGGLFASIGAAFMFGRTGMMFDRTTGIITQWWGLLFPMWNSQYDLKKYNRVTISKEIRKSKNSSTTVYPVRVTGGPKPLDVNTCADEIEARKYAEVVAKFLEVGITDTSGDGIVEREAGTLDESLRDRLKRQSEDVDITSPPPNMRATFEAHGNAVVFYMPPPGFKFSLLLPLIGVGIFAFVVLSFFLYPILSDATMQMEGKYIFGGFIGIFFVLLPISVAVLPIFTQMTQRWEVEADPIRLRVTTRGMLTRKTEEIQCDDLEELNYTNIKANQDTALRALSDEKTILFGAGYNYAELDWIRRVILKAISA